jgi:hypothetical protein
MAVPAVLAFVATDRRRYALTGVLIAVAVLTKPQALFVVPVLAIRLFKLDPSERWRAALSATAVAVTTIALAFMPFMLGGASTSVVRAFQRLGEHDLISGTATNLWWLLAWIAGSVSRLRTLGIWGALTRPATTVRISILAGMGLPNPRVIGACLTLIAFGVGIWRGMRGPISATYLLAAWFVCAYFVLGGQVHENHSYAALVFMAIASASDTKLRWLYAALSAVFTVNLYLFYGLGQDRPALFDRSWTIIDASVLLSIAYLAVFAVLTSAMIRRTRPSR